MTLSHTAKAAFISELDMHSCKQHSDRCVHKNVDAKMLMQIDKEPE